MKPFLTNPKIIELYFTYHEGHDGYFEVEVITNDEKDAALTGTMCVGFFMKLIATAIKHKAKIFQKSIPKVPKPRNTRIHKPTIEYFKKNFTWQPIH